MVGILSDLNILAIEYKHNCSKNKVYLPETQLKVAKQKKGFKAKKDL